jgi:hopanoid biosynthesis associated protein HpnK
LKRVIFTADDFGLSPLVNEAVERAHTGGVLRCASLMVAAPATADAVERARRLPSLRVGLHVVVVNGTPALPPEKVPALVDASGAFGSDLVRTGIAYFARPAARRQLRDEIRAQFEAFRATGLELDHVNAQNHFHVHPTVFATILDVGREFGLRAVRIPHEPFGPSWRSNGSQRGARFANDVLLAPWLGLMRARARRAGVATNDYVFGMIDSGAMTPARVERILAQLPPGTSEVYFHPATGPWPEGVAAMPGYAFADEFAALVDPGVAEALRASGATPVAFADLAVQRAG